MVFGRRKTTDLEKEVRKRAILKKRLEAASRGERMPGMRMDASPLSKFGGVAKKAGMAVLDAAEAKAREQQSGVGMVNKKRRRRLGKVTRFRKRSSKKQNRISEFL